MKYENFSLNIVLAAFGTTATVCKASDTRHFHVAKAARDRYRFNREIFTLSGNVIFPEYRAVREFAHRMNEIREVKKHPELAVRSGSLNAMALIDEILHHLIWQYRNKIRPGVLAEAASYISARLGAAEPAETVRRFADLFPPAAVYAGEQTTDAYLADASGDVSHKEIELEEMLMLWIANMNPAFKPFSELFNDTALATESRYTEVIALLNEFFGKMPAFGPNNQSLIDLLLAPARAHPESLTAQLHFMREKWGLTLIPSYYLKLLIGIDMVKEEDKPVFPFEAHGEVITKESLNNIWGKPTRVDNEYEHFTPDRDWMPRVVMLAKNVHVWLDQLSKSYGRSITRLDEIPEDEIKKLSSWGFSGLWLIGLWERSKASRTIKQVMGNPEAAASAYSLFDYVIAHDLGGEAALEKLHALTSKYGIRLASDMVPNHMSIDSKWVNERPDYFLQLSHPPFPSYTFNGMNLSSDPNIGVYIEDHYYNRTDAAVVFKRVDFRSGDTRYIYHGNDGTSYPWNDTAQLDYRKPEVRHAVIETIKHVARMFPIIRFDAAMTLAKRHYQRLWFPEPGTGGDIPSRAEHAMTKEAFDTVMPDEFWRTVVDTMNSEMPDTLLLAEAFWLMEGYFVRTLGMHRVYNSAFMNFLKNEDNAKYRLSLRNVLEFDPEILQRFVNFMSNPDEKTAVEQFGKEDKYFGCCITMVAMPGLPMLAHGQIEGYTEKYGMEYTKAYWNEQIDWNLVQRHEREVFPLMHKRYLFSGVENFLLYDFYLGNGMVNEDVFAWSNRSGNEKALVIFNNRFSSTAGWIYRSAGFLDKKTRALTHKTLGEGLSTKNEAALLTIFRDNISGLYYIRPNAELIEKGLYVELGAYKYHVFTDFREVADTTEAPWRELCESLHGGGVPDIEIALKLLLLKQLHTAFKAVANKEMFESLINARVEGMAENKTAELPENMLLQLRSDYSSFLKELALLCGGSKNLDVIADQFIDDLNFTINLHTLELDAYNEAAHDYFHSLISTDIHTLLMIYGFILTARISEVCLDKNSGPASNEMVRSYLLNEVFTELFMSLGRNRRHAESEQRHIRAFVYYQNWWREYPVNNFAHTMMSEIFADDNMRLILQLNNWRGVTYFNKESYELFVDGLFVVSILELFRADYTELERKTALQERFAVIKKIRTLSEKSGYQVEKLLELLDDPKPAEKKPKIKKSAKKEPVKKTPKAQTK